MLMIFEIADRWLTLHHFSRLQHGTIGNDLVIKPIPETLKSEDHPMLNELNADPNDDEMFLNEDEVAEMKRNKLRKLEKLANMTEPSEPHMSASENVHVIFKRNIEHQHQQTDFGIYDAFGPIGRSFNNFIF